CHVAPQRGQSVFRREFEQALFAALDRHALGQQVAFAFHGSAHISKNQIEQRAIHAATAYQQHWRDTDSLLVNLAREWHRPRTHTSDVGVVRSIRHEERWFAGTL